MNTRSHTVNLSKTLIAAAVAASLAACAAAPLKPAGAADVRSKLTLLQSDPNLATRAPVAIKEADSAVRTAETPEKDAELAAHRVYIADRKVDTARAQAETRFAEEQRTDLSEQRERARLDARTRQVEAARDQAAQARTQMAEQTLSAERARTEADAVHAFAVASSEQQAAELQRQIDVLQARPTDRGLVLTLGDMVFATGKAELKPHAVTNLDKLIVFLNEYPNRTAIIEGYTDSVGSEHANQALSQRRADSVKSYLVGQGVGSMRLSASGMGENDPVAENDSATGRQQNRRVEVIISNPPAAVR
jgi:outer membrane protein OmpA-like peptidoglycan-associated protein